MLKLIKIIFFKEWSKREICEFWLALILTIIACVALLYLTEILEVLVGRHESYSMAIYNIG